MNHDELKSTSWRKSSYSGSNGGECIEWAPSHAVTDGHVPVRDSKNPHGPTLTFPTPNWTTFITAIKTGHFPT